MDAANLMSTMIDENAPPTPTTSWASIVVAVCRNRDITQAQLYGSCRERQMVLARREVWWRAYRELGLSPGQIAKRMKMDESTVRVAVRAMKAAHEARKA